MSEENITINWEKFKKLVREHGYSFESLGKATGLGRRNIENIKNHDPGYYKMVKIADALDVSLDEFR